MPDSDRTGGHLGELRDALAQASFTLMAVLTEVAAEPSRLVSWYP
jgi:hypothetical protein